MKLNFLKKRQLKVDILTIFITLFLSTVLGIAYYSHWRSSIAVMRVSSALIERMNQSIIQDLDGFLRPLPYLKMSSYLLGQEVFEMTDTQSISDFMHVILETYPQLTNVYLADAEGNMFVENRVKDEPLSNQLIPFLDGHDIPANTSYVSERITQAQPTANIAISFKDKTNQLLLSVHSPLKYDPRIRPWYLGARNTTNELWMGIYQLFGFEKYGISISFPIYLKNKLAGVAAADLDINLIGNELKKFSVDHQGLVFIVDQQGKIIANIEGIKNHVNDMHSIENFNNPIATQAYQIYQQSHRSNFNFTVNHISYIANFTPYGFSKTDQWTIVIILPHDVFLDSIEKANKNILAFSVAMLLLGLLLIVISSHRISKPIMQLADETHDIVKFQFDKPTIIKTHIYEVQVMIDALNAMKSALSSFAKYVPKALVKQLLQRNMIAQLGGKKEIITVLFTDIANFTEMSERLDPELLMLHFSEYLNALTQRIHQYKGNIDKYIGDAIMAFWGAPLEDAHHVENACLCILACQQTVRELNAEWLQAGKPVFYTRFGLNSGSAIVGNLGSSDRLNYTAIGDSINLAARLEALNKVYGTEIIVSQSVYEACAEKFLFRPIDVVRVKGKSQSSAIYELMACRFGVQSKFAANHEQVMLAELSWEAFNLYHQNDLQNAKMIFTEILEKFPQDRVAQIYLTRCDA